MQYIILKQPSASTRVLEEKPFPALPLVKTTNFTKLPKKGMQKGLQKATSPAIMASFRLGMADIEPGNEGAVGRERGWKEVVGYTARQACSLTGLPYDTLDHWARTGFLKPSVAAASGKGSDRAYSFRDLVALRVARELRDAGISLQALRSVVDRLREQGYATPLAEVYLVSDGRDVYTRTGEQLLSLLRSPGQLTFAWVVDLGKIVEELRAALAA